MSLTIDSPAAVQEDDRIARFGKAVAMAETSNWITAYIPLAAALAAVLIAVFQYFTSRPKTKLEMEKLRTEIAKISEASKTNSESISEMQSMILPMYTDETVVYNNTSGNLGFDFTGSTGKIYDGNKPITEVGDGALEFLDNGIINIKRYNTDGRYELYLRKYMLGARESQVIPKDTTEDEPRRFRVACEARSIDDGKHNLRFVMRDREKKKWIGKSVLHRICSPEWRRIEAHFTVPALIEAELRIDDEGVSMAPSTVQIRKLMMTQRRS